VWLCAVLLSLSAIVASYFAAAYPQPNINPSTLRSTRLNPQGMAIASTTDGQDTHQALTANCPPPLPGCGRGGPPSELLRSLRVSPDGAHLAVGDERGNLRVRAEGGVGVGWGWGGGGVGLGMLGGDESRCCAG